MPSRRKLIGRKLERRVVGQATLLALLQPAAEAGCVALELHTYVWMPHSVYRTTI